MTALVEAEDVHFAYGENEVLRGASFQIGAESVVAVVGLAASGKSTLVGVLSTALAPRYGDVRYRLGGETLSVRRHANRIQASLGVVVGRGLAMEPAWTVNRYLHYFWSLYEPETRKAWPGPRAALGAWGVAGIGEKPMARLNAQETRLVDFARATLHGPNVLLVDDPAWGLDVVARAKVWERLKEWATDRPERAVVVASDDAEGMRDAATHVLHVRDGRTTTRSKVEVWPDLRGSASADLAKVLGG